MSYVKNKHIVFYIFFTLNFFFSSQCFGSFENVGANARFQAMGGAGVANATSPDAIFYNCSGIALNRGSLFSFSYANPFGIKELNHGTFSAAIPIYRGNVGFAAKTFGNRLYNESEYFISYAHSFQGKFIFGASVRFLRLEISKYGHDSAIGLDVGFTTMINPMINWGFFTTNLNRANIGAQKEPLPQIFTTGFNVTPATNLFLNVDLYKDTQFPTEIRFGMEYNIFDRLALRSGFITEIASFTAGTGLRFSHFDIDYAFQSHNDLGFTHQFSLTFSLKKRPLQKADTENHIQIHNKININSATQQELQKLKGVGPALASRIIAYREEIGRFDNIDEIKHIKGIGDKLFEKIRPYIIVE